MKCVFSVFMLFFFFYFQCLRLPMNGEAFALFSTFSFIYIRCSRLTRITHKGLSKKISYIRKGVRGSSKGSSSQLTYEQSSKLPRVPFAGVRRDRVHSPQFNFTFISILLCCSEKEKEKGKNITKVNCTLFNYPSVLK